MTLSKFAALMAGALLSASFATSAAATVVTSINGGTALALPTENYFGPGPKTVAPGITWTSTVDWSVYGYVGPYGFGDNGNWEQLPMVGLNETGEEMRFSFASPVAAFGGFLNYGPGTGPAAISAFDAGNNLLETFELTFLTGGGDNSGRFYGFQYATSSIASFVMSGAYIGGAEFVVAADPQPSPQVPEPGSAALLGAGALAALAMRRRTRRSA